MTSSPSTRHTPPAELLERYRAVRRATERLAEPLTPEDCVVQSMPDVSPTKWHLAHTTWFFETFVLAQTTGYESPNPAYAYLFNSYYQSVGPQFDRPRRGLLTRPSFDEVRGYRAHVDAAMIEVLSAGIPDDIARVVETGIHHEQQHQELILMDIKHVLFQNPLRPAYTTSREPASGDPGRMSWVAFDGGLVDIGHDGSSFAFDNEGPRHRVFLEPFELSSRLVTAGEYREFIADGGYDRPDLWLSDGWSTAHRERWGAPLYWFSESEQWMVFTLTGPRPIGATEPVCHVSYYEADAYARWAGARLPTEFEWEAASSGLGVEGNFVEEGFAHPRATPNDGGLSQMFGDAWEWTQSAYAPYPGYRPPAGALGEYNGKFMVNQQVLRGGCCATPKTHVRPTYRNFFYAHQRWPFSGIRLARDATG